MVKLVNMDQIARQHISTEYLNKSITFQRNYSQVATYDPCCVIFKKNIWKENKCIYTKYKQYSCN